MTKRKNIIILIFLTLLGIKFSAFAADLPETRGLNIDPVSIRDDSYQGKKNHLNNKEKNLVTTSKSLKGGVSELTSIIGKSQLVRFDEPVKRLSITNPTLADLVLLSPQEMLLNGKASGITSLIIWGESGDPVFFDLSVRNDSAALLNALKEVMPDRNMDLKFTNDTNVILSGKVSSTLTKDKIKSMIEAYGFKLVDLSESPTPQVMLEIKVVEASRSFTKNLTANYAQGSHTGDIKFEVIPSALTGSGSGFKFDGTLGGLKNFLYFPDNKNNNKYDFSSVLSAAEQKGYIKILAEPKLVSIHGNKASFNAGQQVPVPSGIGQGGNVSYEFKDVGVNVSFTPTIHEDMHRISLNIVPEVSEIDSTTTIQQQDGGVVYGFRTRKADTTVEMRDGQTLIIAGLLQKSDQSTKTQIPILGNIPVIGSLFGNSQFIKGETEMIIFVTPKIIDPDSNTIDGV